MEFDKFARGKKLRAAKVPFAKLPGLIINQAKAFVINPMGFNLILDRVQLGKILGVEIPPAAAPAESAPADTGSVGIGSAASFADGLYLDEVIITKDRKRPGQYDSGPFVFTVADATGREIW